MFNVNISININKLCLFLYVLAYQNKPLYAYNVLSNVLTHLILLPSPMMVVINSILQKGKMRFKGFKYIEFIYTELVAKQTTEETEAKIPISGNLLLLHYAPPSMSLSFVHAGSGGPP